ncbi:MAG TPA: ATP-binding cassette domain-containing protein [Solirubrobacterales bacterium]|jgi:branched-chain amino acid transport system permease protein
MSEYVQYVLSGLSLGCIYALVALGIVLIVNVTGVYNFALGNYVMFGGLIMYGTAGAGGWSVPLAILMTIAAVAGIALLQERLTIAPVRGKLGPLGLLITTLGVGSVLQGAALAIWGEYTKSVPAFSSGSFVLLGAHLSYQTLYVWGGTVICLVAIVSLFRFTDLGRAMRASAINPVAARLHGIRIGSTSMTAFLLAGALAGVIAAVTVPLTSASWNAGLEVTLVAFIAAALAGFTSPGRAVAFGLGLGVLESLAAGKISSEYRLAIVYGTLIVFLLGRDLLGRDGVLQRLSKLSRIKAEEDEQVVALQQRIRERTAAFVERLEGAKPRPRGVFDGIGPRSILPIVLIAAAFFVPSLSSDLGFQSAATYIVLGAIGATGLGLILGLAGQLSLGHAVFYIIGGYGVAILTVKSGWGLLPAAVVAVAASIVVAYAIGRLTVRLSGFNLALATLAIQLIALVVAAQQYPQGITGLPIMHLFGTEFISAKQFFYLGMGILCVCLLIARNIWISQTGLALRAVGRDEEAAESLGLDVSRLKIRILILGAAMASLAGVLWAIYGNFATQTSWDVTFTITLLTYVIVGGVASPFGAAAGAAVVGGMQYAVQESFSSSVGASTQQYTIILSGLFLIFFVLVFRDGLTAIPEYARKALAAGRRRGTEPALAAAAGSGAAPPGSAADDLAAAAPGNGNGNGHGNGDAARAGLSLVEVEELTKRFGKLPAVSDVDFSLTSGEITALIGPNGAGKSTVINMLSGAIVPSDGKIAVMGRQVVGLRPTDIGQSGVARTFQTPRLFEGLTTLENVVLARQRFRRSGLLGAVFRAPRSRREEAAAEMEARAWLDFVGLADDAETIAMDLPVGKQRLAELARALATDPCVLLLDEPAAGLDGTETKSLAAVVRTIRDLEVAVLLVEHDMSIVMSIADKVFVLEEGSKISEGTPTTVGSDPKVIEAYLGTTVEV